MKFLTLILTLMSLNVSATCYPFHPNKEGYNKVCVKFENPAVENTKAIIEVYKNQKVVSRHQAVRYYTPTHQSCGGKEHDCREVRSQLGITTPTSNNNGTEISIQLWEQEPLKCKSGFFTIKNRPHSLLELYMECPRRWWENI
jgi:hypothetical protein